LTFYFSLKKPKGYVRCHFSQVSKFVSNKELLVSGKTHQEKQSWDFQIYCIILREVFIKRISCNVILYVALALMDFHKKIFLLHLRHDFMTFFKIEFEVYPFQECFWVCMKMRYFSSHLVVCAYVFKFLSSWLNKETMIQWLFRMRANNQKSNSCKISKANSSCHFYSKSN